MDFWTQIHFAGMGLQIAAALLGGALTLSWLRLKDGNIEVSPERLKAARTMGTVILWVLALGFIFELWYETHLLQG